MNKQELQGAFSRIHASDDFVKEVLSVEIENKRKWNAGQILWRAAAVAAAVAILVTAFAFWPTSDEPEIIAMPGVMKVYACDLETTPATELEEYAFPEDDFRWRAVWKVTGGSNFGRPITFCIPEDYFGDAEVTFAISSECEGFCDDMILKNGETISLKNQMDTMERINFASKYAEKDFYLDIIVYADGKIVGYGIMSFYMSENGGGVCYAYKCVTVCFPMLDGQYQDVSEEYVWQQIEVYKQAQPEGQGAEFFRKLHENVVE